MTDQGMKIGHYIAACGVCSRRDAESKVKAGLIKINGQMLDNVAYRVKKTDIITCENKLLQLIEKEILLGFYKPTEMLVTHSREYENEYGINVFDYIKKIANKQLQALIKNMHLMSVGRLDYMSEGLLLITNSNKRCSELMHSNFERVYLVQIRNLYNQLNFKHFLEQVQKDFIIEGIRYQAWKCDLLENNSWLKIVLREGKNREIRKVLAFFGMQILRLIRISYGEYKLPKDIFSYYIGQNNDVKKEDLWIID